MAELASVPDDAFSGDVVATAWWDAPTVRVGVGEAPDQALGRLQVLVARDEIGEVGLFGVADAVLVASCAPSDYGAGQVGVVESVDYRPSRPFVGGLRGQAVYAVRFESGDAVVPERYLRTAPAHPRD